MRLTATEKSGFPRWGIYHQEREFAREMGDPCLGVVSARTKSEAETKAQSCGLSGPTGLWAHRLAGRPGEGAPKVSSNADTVVQQSSANNPMAGCSTSWSSV